MNDERRELSTTDAAAIVAGLASEGDAFTLLFHMRDRFGWTSVVWTREDAEDRLGRPMTDDEWSEFSSSYEWDSVSDVAQEYGSEVVWDALRAAGLRFADDDAVEAAR